MRRSTSRLLAAVALAVGLVAASVGVAGAEPSASQTSSAKHAPVHRNAPARTTDWWF